MEETLLRRIRFIAVPTVLLRDRANGILVSLYLFVELLQTIELLLLVRSNRSAAFRRFCLCVSYPEGLAQGKHSDEWYRQK